MASQFGLVSFNSIKHTVLPTSFDKKNWCSWQFRRARVGLVCGIWIFSSVLEAECSRLYIFSTVLNKYCGFFVVQFGNIEISCICKRFFVRIYDFWRIVFGFKVIPSINLLMLCRIRFGISIGESSVNIFLRMKSIIHFMKNILELLLKFLV